MRVSDIMSQPPVTVLADDLLSDVLPIMIRQKLSGVPVKDAAGNIVGVLSEGDLLRRIELGSSRRHGFWTRLFASDIDADSFRRASGRRVRDVMSESVVSIQATDTLADAARLMETHSVKRLPVFLEGKLVGMLTRTDFMKALVRFLAPSYDEPLVSDDEICAKLKDEVNRQTWARSADVSIGCSNGVVTLKGYAVSDQQRRALVVAAETTEGVRSVDDQIEVLSSIPSIG